MKRLAKLRLILLALSLTVFAKSTYGQSDLSLNFTGQRDDVGCFPEQIPCGFPVPIAPGGRALYALYIYNHGPSTATGVTLTITFAPHTLVNSFGATPQMPCVSSTIAGQAGLTCTVGNVSVGSVPSVVVVINLQSDYSLPTLVATATVTAASDPNASNNTAVVTLPVSSASIPTMTSHTLVALAIGLALAGAFVVRQNA